MESLIECFNQIGITDDNMISIIGSGGKTSLMWFLATHSSKEKILISTTTKIGMPNDRPYDHLLIAPQIEKMEEFGSKGISVVAEICENPHKLKSLPLPDLKKIAKKYNQVILECDGSKQLPLKGWAEFEPVILEETDTTVGIVPISVLGKEVAEHTVHRLNLFLPLVTDRKGDQITPNTLAQVIEHSEGLFQKAIGKRVLYLNQVDTSADLQLAKAVVEELSADFLNELQAIIAGSIKNERGIILLWKI